MSWRFVFKDGDLLDWINSDGYTNFSTISYQYAWDDWVKRSGIFHERYWERLTVTTSRVNLGPNSNMNHVDYTFSSRVLR